MKYRMHVSSMATFANEPDFFIGTPFAGEEISSIEDFKKTLIKFGSKDGKWYKRVKINFNLTETFEAFKKEGDFEITNSGMVDLFKLGSKIKQDPLSNITIYWSCNGWIKDGIVYNTLIEKNGKITPFKGKVSEVLPLINIKF